MKKKGLTLAISQISLFTYRISWKNGAASLQVSYKHLDNLCQGALQMFWRLLVAQSLTETLDAIFCQLTWDPSLCLGHLPMVKWKVWRQISSLTENCLFLGKEDGKRIQLKFLQDQGMVETLIFNLNQMLTITSYLNVNLWRNDLKANMPLCTVFMRFFCTSNPRQASFCTSQLM